MSRYIDADKLKEILYITANFVDVKKVFERYIDKTPTEDVKPIIHGHFVSGLKNGYIGAMESGYCSECNSSIYSYWNYCPFCGADMRKDREEEWRL